MSRLPSQSIPLRWMIHGAGFATLVVVAGVFYLAVHLPCVTQTTHDEQRAMQLRKLLRSSPQVMTQHEEVGKRKKQLAASIEEVRSRIPESVSDGEFLAEASQLADGLGVQILDYRRGVIENRDDHSQMSLDLRCVGEYESMCKFVDRLETLPRLVKVKRLAVTAPRLGDAMHFDIEVALIFGAAAPPGDALAARSERRTQ